MNPEHREFIGEALPAALEFYLDVHAHPELSGCEQRTAGVLASGLGARGFEVTTGIGGHGVVGVLRSGDGPTVLVRAELDALPVREATGLPYASEDRAILPDGSASAVMHACGHDAHLASVLGAADVLARLSGLWSGQVVVVGQPAEETLTGASAMLADGLYDRFGVPDVVLAQHLAPFPVGCVAHTSDDQPVLAAGASLRVTLTGTGGHAADPAGAANPIDLAARLVAALPGVAPEAVVTTSVIRAGIAVNVLPEQAELQVSVRATTAADRDRAVSAVITMGERIGHAAVEVMAASEPTVCDTGYASLVRRAHQSVLGKSAVMPWQTSMATEDFPAYSCGGRLPIVYWMLGCVGRQQWERARQESPADVFAAIPANHSPRFAPDAVPTLRTGITAMASAAFACLGHPANQ